MGNSRNIKGQSLTGRDTVVRGAARVPMRFYIVGKHKVPTDAPTAATTDVPMGVVKPRPTHMFSDGRSDGRHYLQHFSDGRPDGRSDGRCKLQHFSRRTLFSLQNFGAEKFGRLNNVRRENCCNLQRPSERPSGRPSEKCCK